MKIGGIEFPYDRYRDVRSHGPVARFLLRVHPLVLWVPGMLLGLLIGLMK